MSILNFPDNPEIDDQYTGDNGTTYTYDGVKWVGRAAGGAAGTNSLQNGTYTVQVDAGGNLIIPENGDIVRWNGNAFVSVLGGSGDGSSITLTGTIPYVDDVLVASPVTFNKPNNSTNTVDVIDTGLTLKRSNNGIIYNSAGGETSSNNSSPLGTEWNADGWGDLADVKSRTYTTFTEACNGNVGEYVTHKEFVMHDTINDKYYTFKFTWWQPGNGYGQNYGGAYTGVGGFSYVRQLINTNPTVYFVRTPDSESTVDDIDTGLSIKRDTNGGGIYNSQVDETWDADVTPSGTLWNDAGWDDFTDITTRTWKPFYAAMHGKLGEHVVNRKMIMHDTVNDKYYVVMFTDWGQNNSGGSFAYWRREISPTGTNTGITFADGTKQTTAYNPGDIAIVDNTIKALHNTSINIQTTSDPLINADINIMSSDDIYIEAKGGEGVYAQVDNNFTISTGASQFNNYEISGMSWVASTLVFTNWNGDLLKALQLYANNTYNLDFRLDTGEWKGVTGTNVYSVGNATYDSGLGRWTIPINIDNTGEPMVVTDVRLRDPDYDGNKYWHFDRHGNLEASYQWNDGSDYNNNIYGPTLSLGQTSNNSVITNAKPNQNNRNGGTMRIQGARGYGSSNTAGQGGVGTNIQIFAGQGGETDDGPGTLGGNGGGVEIIAGNGQYGGSGGNLTLRAGGANHSDGTPDTTVNGGHVYISGGDAQDTIPAGKGVGGSIYIEPGGGNGENQSGNVVITTDNGYWEFRQDGRLIMSNGYTFPALNSSNINAGSAPTVVYTSYDNYIGAIKATIRVSCTQAEVGGIIDEDTQICEILVARKARQVNSVWTRSAVASVYGVTHTSTLPLATFTVDFVEGYVSAPGATPRNVMQILAEPTAAMTGVSMWVQVVATEITND